MNFKLLPAFAMLTAVALILTACKRGGAEEEQKVTTEVAVEVATLTRATLRAHVEAYGTIEPEPAGGGQPGGSARLAAPVAGVVLSVPVKEGERISAGTVLVKLDDRIALAAVEKAKSGLAFAERVVARQEKLKVVAGTSDKTMQEASQQLANAQAEFATAQAQLSLVQLTSPLSGTVARVNVQPGQAVDLNTIVAEVVDPARLVVTASVPGNEAGSLKPGQLAEIFGSESNTPLANGSVTFISPQVDPKSGATLVRTSISADSRLRAGQWVRVRIVSEARTNCLAAPFASVVKTSEGGTVVALVEGGKATQKPVKTGLRDAGLVEIDGAGLGEGQTVVTVGAYGLPKETKVRVLKP